MHNQDTLVQGNADPSNIESEMQRLARLILIFAILFAVFIIAPAFFSDRFAPYPLMKNGDVLDLLTPLVLIPIYWLLFQIHPHRPPSQKQMLVFLLFAALWIQGQGMHLVANSIGHIAQPDFGSKVKQLSYFYDEILSHYIYAECNFKINQKQAVENTAGYQSDDLTTE